MRKTFRIVEFTKDYDSFNLNEHTVIIHPQRFSTKEKAEKALCRFGASKFTIIEIYE